MHRLSSIYHLSQLSDTPLMLEAKTIGIVAPLALSTFLASGTLVESECSMMFHVKRFWSRCNRCQRLSSPWQRLKGYQDIPKF